MARFIIDPWFALSRLFNIPASHRTYSLVKGARARGRPMNPLEAGRRALQGIMTIDAVLERLVLSSPQPQQVAEFYCTAFDYRLLDSGDECRCEGPGRSLWIRRGIANQLIESHFGFPDKNALERYAQDLARQGVPHTFENGSSRGVLNVTDPDGRRVLFTASRNASNSSVTSREMGGIRLARLQHYAVRTPNPQCLVDFYSQTLSFRISDLVRDGSGELTAAFLRTDAEHHSLAIFRAPEKRFDHLSCETRDWSSLRDWADALAARKVRIVWGIGRHGPGNDTFFMVLDPDGNLAEISAELETCAEDRPIGLWEHRMETLNQWGVAIMRS
jgi:catechol 2,3-dioxygenase-like lactoylglutathione lyase family enzyme